MASSAYETIIVGAGIAGLTAAAYLSRYGRKVLLIEKNDKCGGLVNSFKRDGFHFDAGVRALEDAGIIIPMLKDLGIELEFVNSPVSIGIGNEIIDIENIDSLKKYRDMLVKIYPESEQEIEAILKIIRKIMKHMDVLYGIQNPIFKDLKRDYAYIFRELLPWFPKFIFTVGKINRMNHPVEMYLEKIIKNRALKDIISQHFFKNTPTFFALSYFSLYLDYFYPKGGVGKLSEALENKIIEFGGEIKTMTMITEVTATEYMIKDQHHNRYEYDTLIWAADLKTFYKITKTQGLCPKVLTQFDSIKKILLENRGGDSVFTLFLEIDEPLESFRKIANGHFFYTPSKQGLAEIHRKKLQNLIDNFEETEKKEVFEWLRSFTKYNTYEISIPGLKDPELTPKGKTGLIISFLAEYDLFMRIKAAGWYEEFTHKVEEYVIEVITNSIYPILKDKIIAQFSFSPISIENRIGSSEGAITGWSFEKQVPVVNKIQFSDRSVLTPISSIYQAGQWVYSPAGVPMSILTGKLAADKIFKKRSK